jgi:dTDP-4-dehydrorhamnose 3,5-epimerase
MALKGVVPAGGSGSRLFPMTLVTNKHLCRCTSFYVLSEVADVTYKVSSYYQADQERGVAWDDPSLATPWPTHKPIMFGRDQSLPRLDAIVASLPDW